MASLTHIDTCLSCYLTDHHNRPGELLLGVAVNNATTYADINEAIKDEFAAKVPEDEMLTDEAFQTALNEAFSTVPDMAKPFDPSLEPPSDDDDSGELCFAWFLLQWEPENVDTGLDASLMDEFARGYIECALWLADDEPGIGEWSRFDEMFSKLSPEAYKALLDDAADFQATYGVMVSLAIEENDSYTLGRAGIDFWLTRNRHGAGFWGRGLGEIGDKLTEAAHGYGSRDLYEGDNGQLYYGG